MWQAHVKLGMASILNFGVLIGHDVEIGEESYILMGAVFRNMAKFLYEQDRIESSR